MAESTQHTLDRVRPPRVQITYDVQIGNAIEKKEIPFVVGIMSDLAGTPSQPLPKMKDRKFVIIDTDSFDAVMAAINPRLAFQVDDKLSSEGGDRLDIELTFNSLDDFKPANVVRSVKPLNDLFEARTRLTDLLAKLDGNDALDALLQEILGKPDALTHINTLAGGNGNGEAH